MAGNPSMPSEVPQHLAVNALHQLLGIVISAVPSDHRAVGNVTGHHVLMTASSLAIFWIALKKITASTPNEFTPRDTATEE